MHLECSIITGPLKAKSSNCCVAGIKTEHFLAFSELKWNKYSWAAKFLTENPSPYSGLLASDAFPLRGGMTLPRKSNNTAPPVTPSVIAINSQSLKIYMWYIMMILVMADIM